MVVVVVDVRNLMLYLSLALYAYVTRRLCKFFVVVLNKMDVVLMCVIDEWVVYFMVFLLGIDVVVGFFFCDEVFEDERFWDCKDKNYEERDNALVCMYC